jgi:peroxiredoxin
MPVTVGQEAPDFTLYSHAMEPFTLSEHRGAPVVLLFFPGAFTSVCTTELNTVNNDLGSYGEDTTVAGVSTDSPFVLDEFRKAHDFAFPLLSDHDAEACAAYGAKYDGDFTAMGLSRIAKRAAFVIDADGVVRYAEVLDNAGEQPDFDAIQDTLTGLEA